MGQDADVHPPLPDVPLQRGEEADFVAERRPLRRRLHMQVDVAAAPAVVHARAEQTDGGVIAEHVGGASLDGGDLVRGQAHGADASALYLGGLVASVTLFMNSSGRPWTSSGKSAAQASMSGSSHACSALEKSCST